MKLLLAAIGVFAVCLALSAAAMAMPIAPLQKNYTQLLIKAGCVAYQVCQTCYRPDGTSYTCNCHMECLPGIH